MERKARNGVPPEGILPSGMIAPAAASPPNAAVMGPKDGTITAKNALNAVMGPKNGTMAALKSYGSPVFIKELKYLRLLDSLHSSSART